MHAEGVAVNDEQQFAEIEKTMFDLSGAIRRADSTIEKLRHAGAPSHLIGAMECVQDEMKAAHKRLMQGTYFAVPEMRDRATAQTSLV